MNLILNTIIHPIFKMKDSYFYKYNNDFIEIPDIELTEFLLDFFSDECPHTFDNLSQAMIQKLDYSQLETHDLIWDLIESGFLTEVIEQDRYFTNKLFFSLFDNVNKNKFQDKISNSEVCVLGLGGSSLIIQQLAQIGIGKITGIDFDILEEKNLNRQVLFKEKDIGKLKCKALESNLREVNSNIIYDFKNIYVDSPTSIKNVISSANIVILALDEPIIDSAIWVYSECKRQKKILISGGVWGDNITYTVFDYSIKNQPCYECLLEKDIHSNDLTKNYVTSIKGKNFSNFNTTTIFNGGILASIITTEIVKLLTNYSEPLPSGSILSINTSKWSLNIKKISIQKNCNHS